SFIFHPCKKIAHELQKNGFWRGMVRFAKASARQSSFDHCEASEGWRRGESNPCPRRYPRKHLHVYPVRFLRSRRCTGTLPTSERPRISFTVRRGRSAVRLACCPRLAP